MVRYERWVFDEAVSFVREHGHEGAVLDSNASPLSFKALIDAGYLEQKGRFVRPSQEAYVAEFIDRMLPTIGSLIAQAGSLPVARDVVSVDGDVSSLVSEGWLERNVSSYTVTEWGESLLRRTARLYADTFQKEAGPEGFEPTT